MNRREVHVKAKDIKVGRRYETRIGVGECVASAEGRWPPAAKFRISEPVPRGVVFIVPRDVIREVR